MSLASIPYQLPPKLIQDADVCKAIGCYVRASRNALGLNQLKLAQLLGVNRTTLLRLEKGTAPLRFALCLTAVEVLGALGARSVQIEELVAGRGGVGETIDLTVNFEAMKLTQEMAEQEAAENSKGITSLLGEEYIPPLVASPLRKK
jgi:DNA-binding XRE family transcriptional regulator